MAIAKCTSKVLMSALFLGVICANILPVAFLKAEEKSTLAAYASKTMDVLTEMVKSGREKLVRISSGNVTDVDRSMDDLKEVICAATERARRLSEWDIKAVEKEAERAFEATIQGIQEYLDLVADDGPVHNASKRIRTAAMEKARLYREKAEAKNSGRYAQLAAEMDKEATKVMEIWEAIRNERTAVIQNFASLKEAKELYIDVKAAKGISAAVKELENVRDDLVKLSRAMTNVQKAVLGESPAGASTK